MSLSHPGSPVGYDRKRAVVHTNFGAFTIRFLPHKAPLHVENFVRLAERGYYDRTMFHRIVAGFMIQGGDPLGTGLGGDSWRGPGTTVRAEFSDVPHVKGTVSMARTDHPDSAGSQFFICVDRAEFLDGQYSAFGQVEQGYEVVEAMSRVPTNPATERPLQPVVMLSVRIVDV
jgi:peptidyl-prolyl cis-trans isomerase B (cyclophilin B)